MRLWISTHAPQGNTHAFTFGQGTMLRETLAVPPAASVMVAVITGKGAVVANVSTELEYLNVARNGNGAPAGDFHAGVGAHTTV